ncbi:MAG TPA: alpha/beta hydrolase [Candidatus Ventrimonas merdavium]|mgnify:FL=1|nr:alpha/beta hydrolase [Candidatus Ventrimonas merdavium]
MLTKEEKERLITHLRGTSVAKENITPEYCRNLELAERTEVQVPTCEGPVPCYVFTAKNRTPQCRVHINIHGGGFVRPHVLRDEIYSAKIADAIEGIVVDVDYSLAPEYPYPTAFHQCYDICKWVFSMLPEWDGDSRRVSLGGHSAGANLTAAVCLKANQTKEFQLCFQVLDYGAFDMVTDPSEKPGAAENMIPVERGRMFNLAYTDGNLEVLKDPYCSPLLATDEMLRGLPEALVISAGNDNFRFEDAEYAKRLSMAGVKVTAKCFLNSNHGFIVHCTEEWEEGQDLVIAMLRQASL